MSCTSPPRRARRRGVAELVQGLDRAGTPAPAAAGCCACSTRSDRLSVSSGQCDGSSTSAGSTTASHSSRARAAPQQPPQRQGGGRGSAPDRPAGCAAPSGWPTSAGALARVLRSRRGRRARARRASRRSCSRSAACSWPSSWMISSCVGASSPSSALRELPQLVDAALAVHRRDHQPRRRREAVDAARRRVLQQVPELAAVAVPVQPRARDELRPQLGDAVPEAAVERCVEHDVRASSSRAQGAASRTGRGSRSTAGCARRRRPCRRLPCPGRSPAAALPAMAASTRKTLRPSRCVATGVTR